MGIKTVHNRLKPVMVSDAQPHGGYEPSCRGRRSCEVSRTMADAPVVQRGEPGPQAGRTAGHQPSGTANGSRRRRRVTDIVSGTVCYSKPRQRRKWCSYRNGSRLYVKETEVTVADGIARRIELRIAALRHKDWRSA